MLIQAKQLTRIYGSGENTLRALDGVTLSVERGGFVSVVGSSGSGKSTLLHLLGGLDRPTGGSVTIDGTDLYSLAPDPLTVFRRRYIGFVFQSYNLIPGLNAWENIILPLGLDGLKADREETGQLLSTLGIYEKRYALPSQLSGGQQQRVALARALVLEPGVLLFDEPLSNLDAKLRVSMRTEIRKIQQKVGITAIYVTHDQSEAMSISDKIIIMSKGKVEQIGTPREIYYHPNSRFVADFIGEANFLDARVLSADGDQARIQVAGKQMEVGNFGSARAGDTAALVIRPEAAVLADKGQLEATVMLSTFMGAYQYYQVLVDGMELQITDYNPVNRRIYEVGEKAFLDFDSRGVYIL